MQLGEERSFIYPIWPRRYSVPGFTYRARSGKSHYYREAPGNTLTFPDM